MIYRFEITVQFSFLHYIYSLQFLCAKPRSGQTSILTKILKPMTSSCKFFSRCCHSQIELCVPYVFQFGLAVQVVSPFFYNFFLSFFLSFFFLSFFTFYYLICTYSILSFCLKYNFFFSLFVSPTRRRQNVSIRTQTFTHTINVYDHLFWNTHTLKEIFAFGARIYTQQKAEKLTMLQLITSRIQFQSVNMY